ncbi:MAG TPA: diaminopimelate epimerase [Gemmatimonadaceae bacterium]|nr:diaminopimelate epimerase [Gemmatimonadaceae bacterium]
MTGSGNDFVFVDGRSRSTAGLDAAEAIAALCSRTDGVGADGVVIIETDPATAFRIRYYNRDGSRGELCGNASLCSASLATRLGMTNPAGFAFNTDVGQISARMEAGLPEIDLPPIRGLRVDAGIAPGPGERRIGFADTGVPHLVVLVDDADQVNLMARGRELRFHPSLPAGANVNFVSAAGSLWRMRTYERGVEGETLACGTGSVASAALLVAWGLAQPGPVGILTTSGRQLVATIPGDSSDASQHPALRGEGRLVFTGRFGEA